MMGIMTNVAVGSPTIYQRTGMPKSNGREISRLITAAVINRGFCQMLLDNPKSALASGYKGETFALETEEQDFIFSIQAASLAEFATQLVNCKNGSRKLNGNGHRRWA
jgi:hypothetical protein